MKVLILVIALLGAINCSTLNKFTSKSEAEEKIYVESKDKDGFDIKLKNPKESEYVIKFKDEDSKRILVITNPATGSKWTMSVKDFKIFTIGYKNWRSVEDIKPVITEIKEDGEWISFTFNYYKELTDDNQAFKASILSGVVSINKKYVRTSKDENSKYWIWGLGTYSVVITTILFIVIL